MTTQFQDTLPPEFRRKYSPEQIAAQAAIVGRRCGNLEVGIFGTRGDLTGVCVVADDQPGLLSRVSEAFVACGLDIVEAEAFTRNQQDAGRSRPEVVDLFWLRQTQPAPTTLIGERELQAIRSTLSDLIEGRLRSSSPAFETPGQITRSNTCVRFIEDDSGALCTLEIETDDRSGLLLSLSRALTAQQVQIVRSEVKTLGTRVVDRFAITELDGTPVAAARRLEIQVSVLNAAEPAKRLSTPAPPASNPSA